MLRISLKGRFIRVKPKAIC